MKLGLFFNQLAVSQSMQIKEAMSISDFFGGFQAGVVIAMTSALRPLLTCTLCNTPEFDFEEFKCPRTRVDPEDGGIDGDRT